MGDVWSWTADGELARLDRTLTDAIEQGRGLWNDNPRSVSRSQIQRLIEEGNIAIDGKVAKSSSKLSAGVKVQVTFPPPVAIDLIPEDRPIEILYQDKDLLVVNKPPGLTVHPSETQRTGTLVHALLHHVKDLSGIGGELRPGIVHRIDKDTSGALVITKTDEAHRKLVEVFSEHAIDRVYWALAYGSPVTGQGKIEGRIGRSRTDRKKMAVLEDTDKDEGRHAITHYKRLQEFGTPSKKPFASWIEAKLETGRTHQVRVHLTSLGHSLLGDPIYGTPSTNQAKWQTLPRDIQQAVQALPGQALHARVLGFDHPITGKKLHFEAELPEAYKNLLASLKKYSGT
jgi:23S rRNA pseudouridine1911/1915/1917 synthase